MKGGVLVIALALAGCSGDGPPIEMTVPRGFAGPIWIVQDDSAPELALTGGRYRITIPPSGVVRVRSFSAFEKWHQFSAQYEDGSPLRHESDGLSLNPEIIALRGGNNGVMQFHGREYRHIQYFVGTADQANDFMGNVQVPPGAKE